MRHWRPRMRFSHTLWSKWLTELNCRGTRPIEHRLARGIAHLRGKLNQGRWKCR
jgi:hypothetical protein